MNFVYVIDSNIHRCNTRNRNKIRSAFSKHRYMYSNFRFISVHIWNLVISHINISVSIFIFKSSWNAFLFSEEFNLHTSLEKAIP